MEIVGIVMVLPRAVCIVRLVLIHKSRVVSIQAVGVPVLVVVSVPILRMALVMCGIMVLVVVVMVCMGGLLRMRRRGGLSRGGNRHRLLLVDLLRLLLGDRCCGMHRHWHRCSMLRGWHRGGYRCWGWDSGSRDGSARLVLLLRVLGLRVCWGKVVVDWIMLCDLGLNVLRVCLLVVRSFVDLHMGCLQLGAQTAGHREECRTGRKDTSERRPLLYVILRFPYIITSDRRHQSHACCHLRANDYDCC